MRVVGLLRGVNVGGRARLKMSDLRAVVESLGHADVATYLQSGNVVFTATGSPSGVGAAIRERLREVTGLDVRVLTRTGDEMAAIVGANPYRRDDPTKVVVTFLSDGGAAPELDPSQFAPEAFSVRGREVYLDLPFGQGRSALVTALGKFDDGTSTSRNWRTVLALAQMSGT